MNAMLKVVALVVLSGVFLIQAGCQTKAQTGALVGTGLGAAAGAGIGSISGNAGKGALIGAGAGAIGGYIIGNEADKADERRERAYERAVRDSRYQEAPRTRRVTQEDVIAWTRAGERDEIIIDRIYYSGTVFRLTAADEHRLRDSRVSEEVVRAMKDTAR